MTRQHNIADKCSMRLQALTCDTASLRLLNALGGQAALILMFVLHRRLHPAAGLSRSAAMVRVVPNTQPPSSNLQPSSC